MHKIVLFLKTSYIKIEIEILKNEIQYYVACSIKLPFVCLKKKIILFDWFYKTGSLLELIFLEKIT